MTTPDLRLTTSDVQWVNHVEERDAICGRCGGAFTQRRFATSPDVPWRAPVCDGCMRELDRLVALSEREEPIDARIDMLNVPPLYAHATLESFEVHGSDADCERQRRILARAYDWLARWPSVPMVTVLQGGVGTGKGHVAWALAKMIVHDRGASALVVKLADLIRDLRSSWGRNDGPSEVARLAWYREPDLLVIDEVSTHAFYGESHRHLYDLVDHRQEWQRPTILTTNEEPEALRLMLGPALTSRIAGEDAVWNFGAHDYRVWAATRRRGEATNGRAST